MNTAPWSLHLLSEVLAAFSVQSPTALRDVVSRVGEAVDAEVMAILGEGRFVLCTGLDREDRLRLQEAAPERRAMLQLSNGPLHLYWATLNESQLLLVGRLEEPYSLEERALLRAMGRSIELSMRVLDAVAAERLALQAEKRSKEAAIREATIDHLTGVANRRWVLRHLSRKLRHQESDEGRPVLLFIDLDRFKHVNDIYGHTAGDQYLQTVAAVVRSLVREQDMVGRLAGDEFIVITTDTTLEQACSLGRRILERLHQPFAVAGRQLLHSASMGIARAEPGDTPEILLENADLAMYAAKQRGTGSYACFEPAMREQARHKAELEAELRLALDNGEILAHFQPIVASSHGAVTGFEALARWHHPHRGLLHPDVFIAIAEEAGLARELDAVVLQYSCREVARWPCTQAGLAPRLSVNISAQSLADPLLGERVRTALAQSGLESDNLFLEITETSLIDDSAVALQNIHALKQIGVRLTIDDFGIGYSSLRYLRRFPVGILKIDQSFIAGLSRDHDDEVIVETVIRMAHSLGIQVIAEGVETDIQEVMLRRFGCDYLQGYRYGRAADGASSSLLFQRSMGQLIGLPAGEQAPERAPDRGPFSAGGSWPG